MALLTRFIRLPDRANTHVFTFVVTRSVTRDLHRDVTSKEFGYGYHRWAITFSRAGKVLGVYLVWRNPSEVIHFDSFQMGTIVVQLLLLRPIVFNCTRPLLAWRAVGASWGHDGSMMV